jgi:adenine-specific DNA-methyltransferase
MMTVLKKTGVGVRLALKVITRSFFARVPRGGTPQVYYKYRASTEGTTPLTLWTEAKFSATEHGTKVLKDLFNGSLFSYPKSIFAVIECLSVMGLRSNSAEPSSLALDYFGGSGTTAHAVINLNRQDNGQRKYILMEQGEYFDTVLKPRIQKVVFSENWKEGKAQANNTGNYNGISHAFKVLKIESYEDTLNNLELTRSKGQADLLNQMQPQERSQYLMHYMLKLESKDSLLSVTDFLKPFGYQLNITTDSAGAYQTRTVDLVETFNYLLGLRVKQIDMQLDKGFVQVIGTLPNGESALIFWRDCDKINYEQLNKLLDKLHINPRDAEYDVIYVNGDHNIPTVFQSTIDEGGITRTQKIRQIEREFLDRMFAGA